MKARPTVVLWTVCAAMLAGCSGDGLGAKYTATSSLRVSSEGPAILGQPVQHSEKEYDLYKNTQRQLLKSRYVLLAALRKPEVVKLPAVQMETQKSDPVRWLEGVVKVEFPGDAEIMTVSVARSDPNEAVTLARAVVDAYLTEVVNAERDQKRQRLSELDRAYVEKKTEVIAKCEDLEKLAEQLGVSDTGALTLKQRLVLEKLAIYRQEMAAIQAKLRGLKGDLAVQKASLADAKDASRDPILKEIKRMETTITVLSEQEEAMKKDLQTTKQEAERFGTSTVDIEMMRADIKIQNAVLAEIGMARERLKVECRATPRVTLLQRAELPESKD
jgi:hypothetical protein